MTINLSPLLFLLFISFLKPLILLEVSGKPLDIRLAFGPDCTNYFQDFDILMGDMGKFSSDLFETPTSRSAARYNISQEEIIGVQNQEVISNSTSSRNKGFWAQVNQHKNESLAIVINLDKLESLEKVLRQGSAMLQTKSIAQATTLKPYFFIVWSTPLSHIEERNLIQRKELAKGLALDTDVYLVFLKCLKKSDILHDPKTNNNNAGNGNDTSSSSTSSPQFPFRIPVNGTQCEMGQAEVRMLEFYDVKGRNFVELVDPGKENMNLAQKVVRRTNFEGAKLSTVAMYGYPYRAQFSAKNDSFLGGYEADQVSFLGESLNMSLGIGVGTGWITLSNNGSSVTGIGQQISSGEADISISASEFLPYRAQHIQFLHPTYHTQMYSFFVQPSSSSFRDIFIHAFTGDLWLTMLSTWFLIILAMYALAKVKQRLDTMHEHDVTVINEVWIWSTGVFCQQGWHVCPESTCMKIVFIFALITGLVTYVAYSAALVSILSVKVVPIKNLKDIVDKGFTIYQDNQTINSKYIIEKLENEGLIMPLAFEQRSIRAPVAYPKVLDGSAAFIGASDFFYPEAKLHLNDTMLCNTISRIMVGGRPVPGGMFVKRGSPFKDYFNHRLIIMHERGIRYRLLETYFRLCSVMCLEKSGATKDPLGFNDVYTAFLILGLGYCLSLTILFVERMFPPNNVNEFSSVSKELLSRGMYEGENESQEEDNKNREGGGGVGGGFRLGNFGRF